jgi:hypothetical protein
MQERTLTTKPGNADAVDELLGGTPDLVWQRAANASCSLWSRTLVSNAGPAKTVVGSVKRPTQTTARRLRYGVARTDTSDFSAPRGRHHCGDMRIHRISCCAEEQATRTRVLFAGLLLWIDRGRDPVPKAARDTSRHRSFRCSRPRCCGITGSTRIGAAAVAPPDEPPAPAGTSPFVDGIGDDAQIKVLTSYFVVESVAT